MDACPRCGGPVEVRRETHLVTGSLTEDDFRKVVAYLVIAAFATFGISLLLLPFVFLVWLIQKVTGDTALTGVSCPEHGFIAYRG